MSSVASSALAKALEAAKKINATPGFDEGGDGDFYQPAKPVLDQSTKHARKIYAGGLPAHSPTMTDETLLQFFNEQLERVLPVKEPGDVIVTCFLGPEKRYAFLEHRSITEAAFTLTLDGLYYDGQQVKIRRPQDYNIQLAEEQQRIEVQTNSPGAQLYQYLQSNQSVLNMNHSNNPEHISNTVDDGPNKVFLGGLPHTMTDEEVKEILQRFGPLKSFHLVKERNLVTGEVTRSKGFGFCEWRDPNLTEMALMSLNGQPIGHEGRILTVRRALPRGMQAGDAMGGTDSWSGPSLGVQVPGGNTMAAMTSIHHLGTGATPLSIGNMGNSLMLTNGASNENKMVRYGHMGNLGYEAVSAYLSGRLPFQGDFKPSDEHIDGLNDLDCAGFDCGAAALFPGEGRWLELTGKMIARLHLNATEEQQNNLERECQELRHELWGVLNRPELMEKFGKPGRAVGLTKLNFPPNDYAAIQKAITDIKGLVDECIGDVKYGIFHPSDGGVIILEMGSICDAYRVVRSLNGRHYLGRPVTARFVALPAEVKQASLLRIKTELDNKFQMTHAQRDEHQKALQDKATLRLDRYMNEIKPQWIVALREAGMRRKREQDRIDEEAMALMSGIPSTLPILAKDESPNPLELFHEELAKLVQLAADLRDGDMSQMSMCESPAPRPTSTMSMSDIPASCGIGTPSP